MRNRKVIYCRPIQLKETPVKFTTVVYLIYIYVLTRKNKKNATKHVKYFKGKISTHIFISIIEKFDCIILKLLSSLHGDVKSWISHMDK